MRRRLIKFIFGFSALAAVVLLSAYGCLSFSVGRPLKASEFSRFSKTIAKSLFHQREGGAARAFRLSQQALTSPASSGSIDVGGQTYTFPLPQYAVSAERGPGSFHFLAFASPEEIQNYFGRDLPRAGWRQVDQMGAGHFLEGHATHVTIVQHFYLTTDISEFNVVINDRP